jgi:hypothetical protein
MLSKFIFYLVKNSSLKETMLYKLYFKEFENELKLLENSYFMNSHIFLLLINVMIFKVSNNDDFFIYFHFFLIFFEIQKYLLISSHQIKICLLLLT